MHLYCAKMEIKLDNGFSCNFEIIKHKDNTYSYNIENWNNISDIDMYRIAREFYNTAKRKLNESILSKSIDKH